MPAKIHYSKSFHSQKEILTAHCAPPGQGIATFDNDSRSSLAETLVRCIFVRHQANLYSATDAREADMQTAFSISNVTFSASFNPLPPSQGGGTSLTVNFQIHNRGPNHISGLYVTTDSWATWQIVPGRFVDFNDGGENWVANFGVTTQTKTFEFVIFCDDFGGVNSVPRIWNTNGGAVFQATSTEV